MTLQIKNFLAMLSILSFGFAAHGVSAFADSVADPGQSVEGQIVTLDGSVSFEHHMTLIPLFCEQGSPCLNPAIESKPYWAMVLTTPTGVRYELSRPLLIEADRAPPGYRIHGVYLRAGDQVTLSGIVQTLTDDYGIISEVDSVSVDNQ